VKQILKEGDVIWIQDYHLMLLPLLIRKEFPKAMISFFLHVPFPELSIFQHLSGPAKEGILTGLLGADVIGFHTSDYVQNFLKCTLSILNIPAVSNDVRVDQRTVHVGFFPMGIDHKKITAIAGSAECAVIRESIRNSFPERKIILSIDRLDYTKGILNRLIAFDTFLRNFPAWRCKVVLILIVAPSRREINDYQLMKRQIDEWVGKINGSHSTNNWTPVIYQYRQLEFLELCALYGASDVGLITPLKDGMNLIAKEYVASHTDRQGVLVLSEMAGAIHELSGAISLNPFKVDEIVQALVKALKMSRDEQYLRNKTMHKRLGSYDVKTWANEIMSVTIGLRNRAPAPASLEDDLLEYPANIKNLY
jgi:trehalose 6-phosphate synthase/phosphatase